MGTNKRYGESIARQGHNRRTEGKLEVKPVSLTDEEVGAGEIVTARSAVPVKAWVPMELPVTPIQIEGRARRWTDRAVEVEWDTGDGVMRRAWVWAAACEREGS